MRALIKSTTKRPFRRAGIEFPPQGVEIDLDSLSEAQVEAIYAEPRLKVALLEVPKDQGKAPGKDHPESQPAMTEAGTGDSGAAVTSNPAGASAPAGTEAAPTAKPAKPKAAKPKAA